MNLQPVDLEATALPIELPAFAPYILPYPANFGKSGKGGKRPRSIDDAASTECASGTAARQKELPAIVLQSRCSIHLVSCVLLLPDIERRIEYLIEYNY